MKYYQLGTMLPTCFRHIVEQRRFFKFEVLYLEEPLGTLLFLHYLLWNRTFLASTDDSNYKQSSESTKSDDESE